MSIRGVILACGMKTHTLQVLETGAGFDWGIQIYCTVLCKSWGRCYSPILCIFCLSDHVTVLACKISETSAINVTFSYIIRLPRNRFNGWTLCEVRLGNAELA